MSKKLLFLLFTFLLLHNTVGNAASFHPTNAPVPVEDNCNLPGPSNLTNTGATTTSLSFAWDPVAGSNGYKVFLNKVSNGDLVYNDHIFTESVTVTGLDPDTEYEFKVYSVCSNGELTGFSAIIARTDYVIVEDIIVQRDFNNEQPGLDFPLYTDDKSSEAKELFKIKDAYDNFTLFESEKNVDLVQNAYFSHFVEFNHDNGTAEQPLEWIFGVSIIGAPFNGNKMNMEVVNVFHKRDEEHELVMIMWCDRNSSNGASTLGWTAIKSGYELVKNIDHEGGGGKGSNNGRSSVDIIENGIVVGPNPFQDNLVLRTPHDNLEKATVSLIELISGRVLFQTIYTGGQLSFPVAQLSSGAYIVRYESPTATQSFKVIKTN